MALRVVRLASRAYHIPVLKHECIDYLMGGPTRSGNSSSKSIGTATSVVIDGGGGEGDGSKSRKGLYLDCTLGGGGHTTEILSRGGKVIAFDQDLDAIDKVSKDLSHELTSGNLEIIHTNFANLQDAVMTSTLGREFHYQIDGALFDLGVSSHQIDQPDRGFAYRFDGVLDMRMNRTGPLAQTQNSEGTGTEPKTITALELINNLTVDELAEVFYKYGDESRSQAIACEIVLSRPLSTTAHLKNAICSVTPPKYHIKTLSRCFQALRIAVNNELACLEKALAGVYAVSRPAARLVVLSYHSLEDRVIKDLFREYSHERRVQKANKYNKHHKERQEALAVQGEGEAKAKLTPNLWRPLFKKPVVPSHRELKANSRSRSAKLRVAERV